MRLMIGLLQYVNQAPTTSRNGKTKNVYDQMFIVFYNESSYEHPPSPINDFYSSACVVIPHFCSTLCLCQKLLYFFPQKKNTGVVIIITAAAPPNT